MLKQMCKKIDFKKIFEKVAFTQVFVRVKCCNRFFTSFRDIGTVPSVLTSSLDLGLKTKIWEKKKV